MRLFVGIYPPESVNEDLETHLKEHAILRVKWISSIDRHLTLKFIGPAHEDNVLKIQSVLSSIAGKTAPFQLGLKHAGVFPTAQNPRVLWVGTYGDLDPLKQLNRILEDELREAGCPPETREYSPHLTVARMDRKLDPGERVKLDQFLISFSRWSSNLFPAEGFSLIQSHLGSSGSRYQKLMDFTFQ